MVSFSVLMIDNPLATIRGLSSHTDIKNQAITSANTRGIWKVLSMVFYLRNRFTNPVMFGIILKRYLTTMVWQNLYEVIIMQTRYISLRTHVLFVYWKTQNFSGKYNILPFEKCADH